MRQRYTLYVYYGMDEALEALSTVEAPVSSAFQGNAFLTAFYRNAPANCQPLVVRIVLDGRTLMLLPLVLRRSGSMRHIEAADLGLSDYVAPVLAENFEPTRADMIEIWRELVALLPQADIISLKKIPATICSGRRNPLTLLPDMAEMGVVTKRFDLLTPEGDAGFRRSGYYKEGQRHLRRLRAAEPAVEFRIAATVDQAQEHFGHFLEQRLQRFTELGRADPLARPEVQSFYREMLTEGVPAGSVMFGALFSAGECIATDFGLIHDSTHHGVLTSMTSGPLRRFSPGTVAHVLMLDETVARGIRSYDLGVGEFAYKARLPGEETPLYERHQALSLRGGVALAEARLRRMVRQGLSRYPGLRQTAEQMRRRLRRWRSLPAASSLSLAEPCISVATHAAGLA